MLQTTRLFRTQYWAECLGDGWFIPGDAELELMSPFLSGHPIGEEFSQKLVGGDKFTEQILKPSPGYRIAEQWNDKIYGEFNVFGIKFNYKVRGYFFTPIMFSSNISQYGKNFSHHAFVLATTARLFSRRFKPIIHLGAKDLNMSKYGPFGTWLCSSYVAPSNYDKSGYGYPLGYFDFSQGFLTIYGVPTFPVKTF